MRNRRTHSDDDGSPAVFRIAGGPGKDTLIRVCGKCHSPDNVLANGQDRRLGKYHHQNGRLRPRSLPTTNSATFWITGEELSRGLWHDQRDKATATQLETGLGLSAAEAEAVIQYRKTNGDFKSIDDLKKFRMWTPKETGRQKGPVGF